MNRIAKMEEKKRRKLADEYNFYLDLVDLRTYKKSKEICIELNISERTWRHHCENIMNLYRLGYMDRLVIGNSKGYIATNDKSLINKQLKAKERQFKSMAYNYYHLRKSLAEKENYTIEEFLNDCKTELQI